MRKLKNGSTVISVSVITVICITFLCLLLFAVVECVKPLILQQKLQTIATKYMYVIEKYGYLTQKEKESMLNELTSKGFERHKITLEYPEKKLKYGSLIELKLIYNYETKTIPLIGMEEYNLIVTKSSFSKI